MRSRLAWLLGGIAGAFALRALRRQPVPAPVAEPLPAGEPDERAEELRRKLDESRSIVEEREEFEAGETPVDEAEPAPASSPADRRKHVHERARASVERMERSAEND